MDDQDTKCQFCHKSGVTILRCSACGAAAYCNQSCQKSDWKKHKKACRPFKIEALPGKGFGMVAVRKICQGETILKENPILVVSKNMKEKQRDECLKEQFEKLSKSDKSKLLKLHHDNPKGELSEKLKGIFASNTIEVTPANAIALYPTIPR